MCALVCIHSSSLSRRKGSIVSPRHVRICEFVKDWGEKQRALLCFWDISGNFPQARADLGLSFLSLFPSFLPSLPHSFLSLSPPLELLLVVQCDNVRMCDKGSKDIVSFQKKQPGVSEE